MKHVLATRERLGGMLLHITYQKKKNNNTENIYIF